MRVEDNASAGFRGHCDRCAAGSYSKSRKTDRDKTGQRRSVGRREGSNNSLEVGLVSYSG